MKNEVIFISCTVTIVKNKSKISHCLHLVFSILTNANNDRKDFLSKSFINFITFLTQQPKHLTSRSTLSPTDCFTEEVLCIFNRQYLQQQVWCHFKWHRKYELLIAIAQKYHCWSKLHEKAKNAAVINKEYCQHSMASYGAL